MAEMKHGYLKIPVPGVEGLYEPFYPITKSDLVVVDESTQESLADRLIEISNHMADVDVHLTPDKITKWDSLSEALTIDPNNTPISFLPGRQQIAIDSDNIFILDSIKGKSKENLIGTIGGCDTLIGWIPSTSPTEVPSLSMHNIGDNVMVRLGTTGTNSQANAVIGNIVRETISANKYYIFGASINNVTSQRVELILSSVVTGQSVTLGSFGTTDELKTRCIKFTGKTMATEARISANVYGTSTHAFIDNIFLYELTKEEYDSIPIVSGDSVLMSYIDKNFPYARNVSAVENPYLIQRGENLAPFVYNWDYTLDTTINMNSPTSVSFISTGGKSMFFTIPVQHEIEYHLKYDYQGPGSTVSVEFLRFTGDEIITTIADMHTGTTFSVPTSTEYIRVTFGSTATDGMHTYSNVMLTVGSGKEYQEPESSFLALQARLCGPIQNLTGEPDEIRMINKRYHKIKRWEEMPFHKGTGTILRSTSNAVVMEITFIHPIRSNTDGTVFLLDHIYRSTTTDPSTWSNNLFSIDASQNKLTIYLPSSTTGWGDYSPNANEIRAFLNGWKMFPSGEPTLTAWSAAHGEAKKAWVKHPYKSFVGPPTDGWGDKISYNVLATPVYTITNWNHPTFYYYLATPRIEPIRSEGSIKLSKGTNSIESGTGFVIRENPGGPMYNSVYRTYMINAHVGSPPSLTKHKMERSVVVYKDDLPDYSWYDTFRGWRNGTYTATRAFDDRPGTTYTLSYLKYYQGLSSTINGYISAENIGTRVNQIGNLVSDLSGRISSREVKSGKSSVPVILTPTLLNTWEAHISDEPVQFYKDKNGRVYVWGVIKSTGTPPIPGAAFMFPVGYRPRTRIDASAVCISATSELVQGGVEVLPSGEFRITGGITPYFAFTIDFLAEQ